MLILLFACNQTNPDKKPLATVIKSLPPETSEVRSPHNSINPILNIQDAVKTANTINLLQTHFEFMCDETMKVDYFSKGKEVVKISIDFGTVGDVYAKEDYYYKSGKLIFVYEFVQGGPACEGCIKTDEYRTYIENNEVIKYLKNKDVSKCRKCVFNSNTRHYKLLSLNSAEQIKEVMCSSY